MSCSLPHNISTVSAEKSGTIKKIYLKSGDNVETKDLLIEID